MNEITCSSPVSGHVSVVVGHDNDLQINGTTTPTTNLYRHLDGDDSHRNVISINGQLVVASDLNDINIHKNIKFELDELVTNKFRQVLMREQGNQGDSAKGLDPVQPSPSPSSAPLAPASTKIKPSLSFRNVVNNVLKSDSILRYMKRFKHRSDSESDDDDDDDDHQQQQASKSTEVLANSAAGASLASNAVETDDDDVLCENTNNSNNNNYNTPNSDVDMNAAPTNSSSSSKKKNNKKKKRCTIQWLHQEIHPSIVRSSIRPSVNVSIPSFVRQSVHQSVQPSSLLIGSVSSYSAWLLVIVLFL